MQQHQLATQPQPHTQAALGLPQAAALLVEHFEDLVQPISLDTDAVIADHDLGHPIPDRGFNRDGAARLHVFGSIG